MCYRVHITLWRSIYHIVTAVCSWIKVNNSKSTDPKISKLFIILTCAYFTRVHYISTKKRDQLWGHFTIMLFLFHSQHNNRCDNLRGREREREHKFIWCISMHHMIIQAKQIMWFFVFTQTTNSLLKTTS